jgi:hypothetical protein
MRDQRVGVPFAGGVTLPPELPAPIGDEAFPDVKENRP